MNLAGNSLEPNQTDSIVFTQNDTLSNWLYTLLIKNKYELFTCWCHLLITCAILNILAQITHRIGGNQKHFQQLTNTDKKSIETVFSFAICRQLVTK